MRAVNTINELCADYSNAQGLFAEYIKNSIYVAMPAIVISVNYTNQTIQAQPVVKSKIRQRDATLIDRNFPIIEDVPFQVFKGGNWVCTMPITAGDECLLVFCDLDFSAWFQNGGLQSQEHFLKHNLGSAFAIIGFSSEPNAIINYSSTAIELRSLDGTQKISIQDGIMDFVTTTLNINATTTNISGALNVAGTTTIQDKEFLEHTHTSGAEGTPTGGVL